MKLNSVIVQFNSSFIQDQFIGIWGSKYSNVHKTVKDQMYEEVKMKKKIKFTIQYVVKDWKFW